MKAVAVFCAANLLGAMALLAQQDVVNSNDPFPDREYLGGWNAMFWFENRALPDFNARFVLCTDPPGTSSVTGPDYHVQLLAGPTGAPLNKFISPYLYLPITFRDTNPYTYGYVYPIDVEVPNEFLAQPTSVVVRAFKGATWETASLRYEGVFPASLDVPPGPGYPLPLGTNDLVLCAPSKASPLDQWNWRGPRPVLSSLYGITYGNHVFVAVGTKEWPSSVLTSPDGREWAPSWIPSNWPLYAISYGGGVFVAVGDYRILTSNGNATNWTVWKAPGPLRGMCYGSPPGPFVAVGLQGLILTSFDMINWAPRASGTTQDLAAVTFANGKFVAVGSGNTVLTSPDGFTWTSQATGHPNPAFAISSIAYGNGLFVAAGMDGLYGESIITSPDALHWIPQKQVPIQCVTFANGYFVAAGYGPMLTSVDGKNWPQAGFTTVTQGLHALAYGAGRVLAVGDTGATYSSPDGTVWQDEQEGDPTSTLLDVAYGNDTIVAVGATASFQGQVVLDSLDGVSWEIKPALNSAGPLHGITFGDGRFVAVSQSGNSSSQISVDGADWKIGDALFGLPGPAGVAFGNGTFVSAGETYIQSIGEIGPVISLSKDGLFWTPIPVANNLNSVTFGGGRYVAVGGQGALLISTNATDWQSVDSGTSNELRRVVYGRDKYVAVGDAGTILESTDASQWWPAISGSYETLNGVAYGDGDYVAVGGYGTILTSPDGMNWTARNSGTAQDLFSVVYSSNTFIAVGAHSTVLQSGTKPFAVKFDWVKAHPDGFEAHLTGEPGRSFRIQISTNLLDWADLSDVIHSGGEVLFLDSEPPSLHQRFYRAVAP
jgi:hypothetical protein